MGLVCASEIRKVISEIGDKFGLNAIPQTCPLISAIAARSQVSIENDIGGNFSRPLIPGSCPVEMRPMNEPASLLLPRVREERIESERDIQHRFPQRALNDGELLQQDPLADSNSVFNDFVAIDTFEWTSNWEEGLFNLGFTADSSTYDFMTSASPVLSHTLAVSLIHGQQR
ncbi:unnamed protein product [Penicillium salamii]|nr:unnamed protein product [Penicillium salamii]CAG8296762.1 unnamed protein product [Penicillium salamii]